MKGKLVVCGVLVVICLSVLVVQGVSQPTPPISAPASSFTPPSSPVPTPAVAAPPPPLAGSSDSSPSKPAVNFSTVQPQQDWNFEQLAEALKGVRARQKELKAQEADLLTKLEEKVEQKRKELKKAEETLEQLQNETGRHKAEEKSAQSVQWSVTTPRR